MCLNPLHAYRLRPDFEKFMTNSLISSKIVNNLTNSWLPKLIFNPSFHIHRKLSHLYESITLPCGKCIECKLKHSKMWSLRNIHEMRASSTACFVTLTYDQAHVPQRLDAPDGVYTLYYRDVQLFMKRFRRRLDRYYHLLSFFQKRTIKPPKIRFFCSGEYGTKTARPHYHLIIYNWSPRLKTLKPWKQKNSKSCLPTYRSYFLESIWQNGMVNVGSSVTSAVAGYIARYTLEKNANQKRQGFYRYRSPEILRSSRRGGLGQSFFTKENIKNVLSLGYIQEFDKGNITSYAVPRYYREMFKKRYPRFYKKYVYPYLQKQAKIAEERFRQECLSLGTVLYKRYSDLYEYFSFIVTQRLKRNLSPEDYLVRMNC